MGQQAIFCPKEEEMIRISNIRVFCFDAYNVLIINRNGMLIEYLLFDGI